MNLTKVQGAKTTGTTYPNGANLNSKQITSIVSRFNNMMTAAYRLSYRDKNGVLPPNDYQIFAYTQRSDFGLHLILMDKRPDNRCLRLPSPRTMFEFDESNLWVYVAKIKQRYGFRLLEGTAPMLLDLETFNAIKVHTPRAIPFDQ